MPQSAGRPTAIMATGTHLHTTADSGPETVSFTLAGPREVARWAGVAAIVAAVLLSSVALIAVHDRGSAVAGVSSGLLARHHSVGDVLYVLRRNLLVLGIHLCACWIGAIVGRPHRPAPEGWGRIGSLHRPVPAWMGRAALFYALLVTLLSVAVQSIALGRLLADLSAVTQLSRLALLVLVLPHAVPELIAVFLPLGLFLVEARRGRLERLGPWSLQAAAIALPLLVCAAMIETYVSPQRVIAASRRVQSASTIKTGAVRSPMISAWRSTDCASCSIWCRRRSRIPTPRRTSSRLKLTCRAFTSIA